MKLNYFLNTSGFPAYLAAGLGQPGAAVAGMYGSYGHQLEDLAALQRSTLAASLPAQLVGTAAGQQPASQQTSGKPGVSEQLYRHDSRGTFFSTLALIFAAHLNILNVLLSMFVTLYQ